MSRVIKLYLRLRRVEDLARVAAGLALVRGAGLPVDRVGVAGLRLPVAPSDFNERAVPDVPVDRLPIGFLFVVARARLGLAFALCIKAAVLRRGADLRVGGLRPIVDAIFLLLFNLMVWVFVITPYIAALGTTMSSCCLS